LYAARKLGTPPARCLVFEDALQAVRGAKAAGMTVYGVYDEASGERWEEIQRIADGAIRGFHEAPSPDSRNSLNFITAGQAPPAP
jgi:beta-phosphoglucomutase-like phosphatase (HAD superfamily)